MTQRRTLRSVDLLQGAIVQVEVYLESGAARASGAGDEHDQGKTGVVPHVNPQSRAAWAAGHVKRKTRMGQSVTHSAKHLLEPADTSSQ